MRSGRMALLALGNQAHQGKVWEQDYRSPNSPSSLVCLRKSGPSAYQALGIEALRELVWTLEHLSASLSNHLMCPG